MSPPTRIDSDYSSGTRVCIGPCVPIRTSIALLVVETSRGCIARGGLLPDRSHTKINVFIL